MKFLNLAILFSMFAVLTFSQTAFAQTSHDVAQSDNAPVTKISEKGVVLVVNQTVEKLQYKMGEPIIVHPEMSNVGKSTVFVANGLPLFHVEVRSENGTKVFDSGYSGMLIVGWGFTLSPGMTESDNGTWGSWPKAGEPVIHINVPGRYEILSEANISLYPSSQYFDHYTGSSPLLRLWSSPLEVSVLPEKYEPPQLPRPRVLPNQTMVVEIENGTLPAQCEERGCISPARVYAKPDTMVIWYNHDMYGHTITSGRPNDTVVGTDFDSGVIPPGDSFNQTFSRDGNFSYFDEVRPWITGEIIVSDAPPQFLHLPRHVAPPPPAAIGCYHWTQDSGWQSTPCMNQSEMEKLGRTGIPQSSDPATGNAANPWLGMMVFGGMAGIAATAISMYVLRTKVN
ncbi:MAG: hypothetical protein KGI27_06160 [Thaumarchaeota archaeon]|nr:hypothetical protein [Nitrososphaerota archaeon]